MLFQPRPCFSDASVTSGLQAYAESLSDGVPSGVLPFSNEPNGLHVFPSEFVAMLRFANVKRWFGGSSSLYRIVMVRFVCACIEMFWVAANRVIARVACHFPVRKRTEVQREGNPVNWNWPPKSKHRKLNSWVFFSPFWALKPRPTFIGSSDLHPRPEFTNGLRIDLLMVTSIATKLPLVFFESIFGTLERLVAVMTVHFHKAIVCHF